MRTVRDEMGMLEESESDLIRGLQTKRDVRRICMEQMIPVVILTLTLLFVSSALIGCAGAPTVAEPVAESGQREPQSDGIPSGTPEHVRKEVESFLLEEREEQMKKRATQALEKVNQLKRERNADRINALTDKCTGKPEECSHEDILEIRQYIGTMEEGQ